MKRKDFIRQSALAGFSLAILSNSPQGAKPCIETPGETAGPFPTRDPASLVTQNISSDRDGFALTISIIINNINDKCAHLKDAIVDIWHCDSKGEYSEYGGGRGMRPPGRGGSMQPADHTSDHFLRGRQTTNKQGEASFRSIYPGWYPGVNYLIWPEKNQPMQIA